MFINSMPLIPFKYNIVISATCKALSVVYNQKKSLKDFVRNQDCKRLCFDHCVQLRCVGGGMGFIGVSLRCLFGATGFCVCVCLVVSTFLLYFVCVYMLHV